MTSSRRRDILQEMWAARTGYNSTLSYGLGFDSFQTKNELFVICVRVSLKFLRSGWRVQHNQLDTGHQVHPSIMQAIMKLVQVLQSELRAALEAAGWWKKVVKDTWRHCKTEDIPKMFLVGGFTYLVEFAPASCLYLSMSFFSPSR